MKRDPATFTVDEAQAAADAWGFNCGPGALCAILGKRPEEIRPHLIDFERKGYTNLSLMAAILRGLGVRFDRVFEHLGARPEPMDVLYPLCGLVRVQWGGPWTAPGVPVRARYRHTHWIAIRQGPGDPYPGEVFDINAVCVGGWLDWDEWRLGLVPWLLEQCAPRADGTWWPTHCWEVTP
jgi:hypothetical protein